MSRSPLKGLPVYWGKAVERANEMSLRLRTEVILTKQDDLPHESYARYENENKMQMLCF